VPGSARIASTSPRRLLLITGDGPPDWATTTFRLFTNAPL
jgi:hypothetical protein